MAGRNKKTSKFRKKIVNDYDKLINMLMRDGKKNTSRRLVDGSLSYIESKLDTLNQKIESLNTDVKTVYKTSLQVLSQAIQNIAPVAEIKSRRIGGHVYPVPVEVGEDRRKAIAIRWIRSIIASSRGGKETYVVLAEELMNAVAGEGSAIKKREELHKQVEASRAFQHFIK